MAGDGKGLACPLRGDVVEASTVAVEHRLLASKLLPALHRNIDISRRDLDRNGTYQISFMTFRFGVSGRKTRIGRQTTQFVSRHGRDVIERATVSEQLSMRSTIPGR